MSFLYFLLLASPGFAAETAKVLPKGVFRARAVTVVTGKIEKKFNPSGQLENLSHSLNRSVTVDDLAAKEPKLGTLVSTLNSIEPGLGDQLVNANLYTDVEMNVQSELFALEYGVSDRVSVGIRAPYSKKVVKAGMNVNEINNAAVIKEKVGNLSPSLTEGIFSVESQEFNTEFFEAALFTSKGYEAPHDFTRHEWGDIKSGVKYNFYRKNGVYLTAVTGVRIPTGSSPSLTNPFDTGSGSGAWANGFQTIQEWEATPFLAFGAAQKITVSYPDTRKRAVPKSPDDSLPSLLAEDGQVHDVTRSQAPKWDFEVSSTVKPIGPSVSLWSAYQVTKQGASSYSGPFEESLDYDALSQKTDFELHGAEFGLGYSTIPAYRAKRFFAPLEVKALYYTVLRGTNTPRTQYGRLDLIVYF